VAESKYQKMLHESTSTRLLAIYRNQIASTISEREQNKQRREMNACLPEDIALHGIDNQKHSR
jgi:hypothetical protein